MELVTDKEKEKPVEGVSPDPTDDPRIKDPRIIDALETRPKRVAIVALGRSFFEFVIQSMSTYGDKEFDEVWTLNRGIKGFQHDKLFIMDDLKWIEKRDPKYAEWIKTHNGPVITSNPYPEYRNSIPYPINKVMMDVGDDVFGVNTVSYMIAYAMSIGVEDLWIYGADFVYPGKEGIAEVEKGGQACAYLLGMCAVRGIKFHLPNSTTLLYANDVKMNPHTGQPGRTLYGYHRIGEMEEVPVAQKEQELMRRGIRA